jgi:molybdopterin converting factor small subunit
VLVAVKFLGTLQEPMQTARLLAELPAGATYRDALDFIAPAVQSRLGDWAWDRSARSFTRRMIVSLNGEADLRDEATSLKDGDEILVVLPLAGG